MRSKSLLDHLLNLAQSCFLLLAFALPLTVSAQWSPVYIPADDFTAIEVIGQDTVIAATNWDGRIHRSSDGGQTWASVQTIFTTSWFLDVHFPTQTVGYACGGTAFGQHSQVIAKTLDAGVTWDSLTANAFGGYDFTKLHFINSDTGFVSGGVSGIYKTTDGGANFVFDSIPNAAYSTEVYFESASNGFLATNRSIGVNQEIVKILKTTDLGATWTTVYADSLSGTNGINHRRINKMFFHDATTGFAVGGNGLFLKTTDGGSSWNRSLISPFNNLTAVHFTSANVGFINNTGGIARTSDGGATWTAQTLTTLSIISQLQFANDTVGYAIGDYGIYKTNNAGGLVSVTAPFEEPIISLFPNPSAGNVSVRIEEDVIKQVHIFDMKGELIQVVNSNFESINISDLAAGNYAFEIETKRGKVVRKVIKK